MFCCFCKRNVNSGCPTNWCSLRKASWIHLKQNSGRMLLCWMFVILSCYWSHTPPGNIVMGSPCRASHQRWCISFCRESQGFPTWRYQHIRSPMWSQVALNPSDGCWMLASNGREFWVGRTYLAISISREATLREKVCCKSFPFSPFVNCANACVQLWHSQEVDLFKQSQESTLKSKSLAQFGSRSRASQNPPNDALACSDFGSREKLRLYKTQAEVRRYVESW